MFKRPVIASNVGAMAERIQHGKNGLLFSVGDARSLADAMRRACEEEGLWKDLVNGLVDPPAREEMVKGFSALYETERARVPSKLKKNGGQISSIA